MFLKSDFWVWNGRLKKACDLGLVSSPEQPGDRTLKTWDPSVMLAPSLQPKDVIPARLLSGPVRDGHLMIPKGRFPITTTSHSPSQKPSGAKQEASCLREDKPYFPFPSPPLASPGGALQTTPRLNTPPPRASLEVDPPRLTTGTRSASSHPGPRTHLRPWFQKRPHNQGQRRTQPPAPAEAAALGPAIRHAGSKRGVALGNCTSSPLGCWDLLVLILAFKHYKLFANKTSAQGDETCCRKSHLLSTASSSPPRSMVSPWALPASEARLQFQNGGRHRGASAGWSSRVVLSEYQLVSLLNLDSTRGWEGQWTALGED